MSKQQFDLMGVIWNSETNRRRLRQPKGRSSYRQQNQNELDRFLESKNLWRKHIAKDGSCLFRAVAEQVSDCDCLFLHKRGVFETQQVYLSQVDHLQVRRECVDYIRQHQAHFKEVYIGYIYDLSIFCASFWKNQWTPTCLNCVIQQ